MTNITEYGLIEQDITRSLFETLSEVSQRIYCSEMAKTKKRATHCFTYLLAGELKNVYWTLENHEIERIFNFVNKKLGTVIQIIDMPDTPEKQAGLKAYRVRCVETKGIEGDMKDAGTNSFN
jgi:hypothetical protein